VKTSYSRHSLLDVCNQLFSLFSMVLWASAGEPCPLLYMILIKQKVVNSAIFWSCFFSCPPENFFANTFGMVYLVMNNSSIFWYRINSLFCFVQYRCFFIILRILIQHLVFNFVTRMRTNTCHTCQLQNNDFRVNNYSA